jgi:putative hydrolase of the HAD superfamily
MPSDLIFDFFGTLVQYVAGSFHTAPYERTHAFLRRHAFDIDYPTFVDVYSTIADALERQARQTAREYHMDDVARAFFRAAFDRDVSPAMIDEFVVCFIAEWSRGIQYSDGMEPFLKALATEYRLSILSNTHYPALIHSHLARMQVTPFFTHIVTSVEFGWRKPHPSIFQQVLTDLAIPADAALYIGDSYTDDYQGARAAGIRALLVDPHHQHPDVVDRMSSVFELKQVFL